jgi:hypothetical protein
MINKFNEYWKKLIWVENVDISSIDKNVLFYYLVYITYLLRILLYNNNVDEQRKNRYIGIIEGIMFSYDEIKYKDLKIKQ